MSNLFLYSKIACFASLASEELIKVD